MEQHESLTSYSILISRHPCDFLSEWLASTRFWSQTNCILWRYSLPYFNSEIYLYLRCGWFQWAKTNNFLLPSFVLSILREGKSESFINQTFFKHSLYAKCCPVLWVSMEATFSEWEGGFFPLCSQEWGASACLREDHTSLEGLEQLSIRSSSL